MEGSSSLWMLSPPRTSSLNTLNKHHHPAWQQQHQPHQLDQQLQHRNGRHLVRAQPLVSTISEEEAREGKKYRHVHDSIREAG